MTNRQQRLSLAEAKRTYLEALQKNLCEFDSGSEEWHRTAELTLIALVGQHIADLTHDIENLKKLPPDNPNPGGS